MYSKLNTGIIQLNKVRCNFTKCLRVLVSFVRFIHIVTKLQKSLHLNTSHVFHHVTGNGIQNCTSMKVSTVKMSKMICYIIRHGNIYSTFYSHTRKQQALEPLPRMLNNWLQYSLISVNNSCALCRKKSSKAVVTAV